MDTQGQKVFEDKEVADDGEYRLSLQHLPQGMYLLKILGELDLRLYVWKNNLPLLRTKTMVFIWKGLY